MDLSVKTAEGGLVEADVGDLVDGILTGDNPAVGGLVGFGARSEEHQLLVKSIGEKTEKMGGYLFRFLH